MLFLEVLFIYCVRVCTHAICMCVHTCHGAVVEARGELWEVVLSFHYMGPGDGTRLFRFGSRYFFSPSHSFLPLPESYKALLSGKVFQSRENSIREVILAIGPLSGSYVGAGGKFNVLILWLQPR